MTQSIESRFEALEAGTQTAETGDVETPTEEIVDDVDQDELLVTVLDELREVREENERLRDRVDELETRVDDVEDAREIATSAVADASTADAKAEDADEKAENARDAAKSALATTEQLRSKVEDDGTDETDATAVLDGVDAATSPLDFYANVQDYRVREHFVSSNRTNRFRAIAVAKRWEEFARRRSTGDGIFWKREDVRNALVAVMGEKPHGTTVTRVWECLTELGSDDVEETTRRVSNRQEPVDVLKMDMETADGLLDCRYHHLNLIDAEGRVGGVTPVVTGEEV